MIPHSKTMTALPVLLAVLAAGAAMASEPPPGIVTGGIRVQLLSESVVRLEARGPAGFEDRTTFHITGRNWPGTTFTTHTDSDGMAIKTARYVVRIPANAETLDGVRVESDIGQTLYTYDGTLENSRWLPGPAEGPAVWWFADSPRLIPPAWGLTPAPSDAALPETSGWDLGNDAPDVYVFIPRGDYRQLRRDFLKLTAPTEMPPLFAFGAFDSRWYDYSEDTALQQIEDYRARRIPLDVLVVDTGWRVNASTGYQPNTNLFPNLRRFFQKAHAKNVRVMFNDHPEPVSSNAFDAAELQYRFNGLAGLLREGLDVWWFDRNWVVSLVAPAPNLKKEVWGMREYHDVTQRVRPRSRPLIMANVDGIDNGIRKRPPNVAAHRYPIQWTGDTGPGFEFLRRGVENAVHFGIHAAFPYMSEDLGGHTPDPTPEGYIRWIQYGALSPVYRPHCTNKLKRMPWSFGPEAERAARRFLNLRYRLLPVFYAAARENFETGEPILRRLDLDYPQFPEASRDDQYLLGPGLLVAPVLQASPRKTVPTAWLKTPAGLPGLRGEYFTNETLSAPPVLSRTDSAVDFQWQDASPDPRLPHDYFSARWDGRIEVPKQVGDVVLVSVGDDGVRVWLDDQQVIDAWGGHDSAVTEASMPVSAGRPHRLRIEYQELQYAARLQLQWRPATMPAAPREVWIPPGVWMDAWSGRMVAGPTTVTNAVALTQMPIYVKAGSIVPLAPEMQYTGQLPWDPVTLDLYPQTGQSRHATLYEDDTLTIGYRRGEFRKTPVALSADDKTRTVLVTIGAAAGDFPAALEQRAWVLRIRRPADWPETLRPQEAAVNGKRLPVSFRRLARNGDAMPFGDPSGAPDGDVFELALPAAPVQSERRVEIRFAPS
jgi:hypothetical protein